jgi:hypothetical protein
MENYQSHALVPTTPQPLALPADMDVFRVGEVLAKSGYFKDVRDAAQAIAKIMAGREMGFGAIASLTGVYIQQGRPCYSANMIAAAIKKSRRYDYRVTRLDAQQCDLEFHEAGKPVGVSSFSLKDAEQAELSKGPNAHSWRHYPRNMLFARALTNGARFYCPDVFGGVPIYTPEELNVTVDGESGEVVRETPPRPLRLEPKPEPQAASQETPPPVTLDMQVISPAQQKRLFPLLKEANVRVEDFKAYLQLQHGIEHTKEITRAQYDVICNDITGGGLASWLLEQTTVAEGEAEPGSEG